MQIAPEYLGWAVGLGVPSSISFPLGFAIGLIAAPRERVVAVLGAFGAGVLLAALAVGLVAPTLAELEMQHGNHAAGVRTVLFLIAGCLIGGGVFVVLDRALSERGTFLRKTGNAILHFSRTARAQREAFLTDLCASSAQTELYPEVIAALASAMHSVDFADGEAVFRERDPSDQLYFVRDGRLDLIQTDQVIQSLGPGDLVGELALITHPPRAVGARANGPCRPCRCARLNLPHWPARTPKSGSDFANSAVSVFENSRRDASRSGRNGIAGPKRPSARCRTTRRFRLPLSCGAPAGNTAVPGWPSGSACCSTGFRKAS